MFIPTTRGEAIEIGGCPKGEGAGASESTPLALRSRYGLPIRDCSRRCLSHFQSATGRTRCGELGAHLLDLRGLLVQTCSDSFHLLLLLRDRCFKFVTLCLGVLSLLRDGRLLFLHFTSLLFDLAM